MDDYTLRSTKTGRSSRARRAADIALIVLLAVGLIVLLFKVLLVPVRIGEPYVGDLRSGDVVLVDRFSKFLSDYKLGDIVRAEPEAGSGEYRVAALGGQRYEVRGGRAYLDGSLVDESAYSGFWPEDAELSIEIEEDEVLLLPDSREGIGDLSHFIVLYNSIVGEVRLRVSPISDIALFF